MAKGITLSPPVSAVIRADIEGSNWKTNQPVDLVGVTDTSALVKIRGENFYRPIGQVILKGEDMELLKKQIEARPAYAYSSS